MNVSGHAFWNVIYEKCTKSQAKCLEVKTSSESLWWNEINHIIDINRKQSFWCIFILRKCHNSHRTRTETTELTVSFLTVHMTFCCVWIIFTSHFFVSHNKRQFTFEHIKRCAEVSEPTPTNIQIVHNKTKYTFRPISFREREKLYQYTSPFLFFIVLVLNSLVLRIFQFAFVFCFCFFVFHNRLQFFEYRLTH